MLSQPSCESIVIRSVLLCFMLIVLSTASRATDIHKCATPTGIAYQGHPCSGAELPTSRVIASAAQPPAPARESAADDDAARGAPICNARPREPRRLPLRQATICIGMTDDEVLNLPGWGRPATIKRSRATRQWREEWTYDAGLDGPRQLHFINGTLTMVERPVVERGFVAMPSGPIAKLAGAPDAVRAATN
jgi:hypothetical protein